MLRITPLDTNPHHYELRVEGRVAGEASREILLEELAKAARLGRPLVLELSGVDFVDGPVLALLLEVKQRGVTLVGSSAWLTSLLEGAGA